MGSVISRPQSIPVVVKFISDMREQSENLANCPRFRVTRNILHVAEYKYKVKYTIGLQFILTNKSFAFEMVELRQIRDCLLAESSSLSWKLSSQKKKWNDPIKG